MSENSSLLRHTLFYLPAQLGPPATQFVLAVLWTYLLDPATLGVVTFVIAAQEMTAFIGITPWSLFMLRFRARFREGEEARFNAMDQRMTLLACLVQFLLTFAILWLLGVSPETPIILATTGYLISRTLLTHYGEWARADHAIAAYTTGQLIGALAGAALSTIAILIVGPRPESVLGGLALGQLIALAINYHQLGLRVGFGVLDREILADVLRYGAGAIIVSGVVGWVAVNINRVIVQYLQGPEALGLMSVGWGLGQRIAAVIAMLLTAAAYPLAVQHLERGDRKGALEQISFNGVFLFGILAPTIAGGALLAAPMTHLLISSKFHEMTVAIFPVALAASALRSFRLHTADQTMLLLERNDVSMRFTVIESVMNIFFCTLGLAVAGVYGAAIGMMIGTAIACAGGFFVACVWQGLPAPRTSVVLRILFATMVMALCVRALPTPDNLAGLFLAILLGALVYAGMTFALFPQCRELVARRMKNRQGAPAA